MVKKTARKKATRKKAARTKPDLSTLGFKTVTAKIGGATFRAKTPNADVFYPVIEMKIKRDQDNALIAACVVGADDKPLYTPAEVDAASPHVWARLYRLTSAVCIPEDAEKK